VILCATKAARTDNVSKTETAATGVMQAILA
jgi:hypothetical protein